MAVMGFRIRHRLMLPSVLLLILVSFGLTALSLTLSRGWIEEDLRDRAITFAREIAATIGDRRELESSALLREQIEQILTVRQSVLQLDILSFDPAGTTVVATSHPDIRLPFTRAEVEQVLGRRVVSRLVAEGRYWEVLAPITLQGTVAGGVAAKFSVDRADRLASRIRRSALALTAVSVLLMGLAMSLTIRLVVDRPLRQFMDAVSRQRDGDGAATVRVASTDEFGMLATHFNDMVARLNRFNDELQARVQEATTELDRRYRELQELNAVLFEMQRSLGHAERLALAGRIMAEVAHEIGTPLHSVAGHLELLRKNLGADLEQGDAARRLAIVEAQVTRVIEIITQLLDLTRRSPGEPGPVDLNRLVSDTVDLVRPSIGRAQVALELRTDPAVPPVHGYPTQLQQVVLNLLTNAMDATPPGGRVEVVTLARPEHEEVEVRVSDSGHGIPIAHRKRIFEPFFSTKESGRGTGLGLFISAQIVRDHKGRIEVASDEGWGSRFRVVLPAGSAGGPA